MQVEGVSGVDKFEIFSHALYTGLSYATSVSNSKLQLGHAKLTMPNNTLTHICP